jgi:Glycosyl hydrolases family 38 N-terminal domain
VFSLWQVEVFVVARGRQAMAGCTATPDAMKTTRSRFFLIAMAALVLAAGASRAEESPIHRIYLIHFSHTDVGFTDMPGTCRELQRRYLDIALDGALATMAKPEGQRFHWTCESLITVDDWWQAASPARRKDFLKALRSGQLAVAALPFNQTPFQNAAQWRTMLHWVPEELWRQFQPAVALQSDVNGFPRAGAMALLDRGITRLCMSINGDSGGPPCFRPSAFWWKMPDGRRLFVYLNDSYPNGYDFFESTHWRRGPVPFASDTRYRPPRAGDFFRTDEASLRAAHAQCLRRIEHLVKSGYKHDVLTISVTNHWRMDNDPPFLPLADFVAAWNRLGLKPELVFTTAPKAMAAMEKAIGGAVPEYEGEFSDWWANGAASGPREVAASRAAKRSLAAAQSPLWGPMPASGAGRAHALYQDLCLFDEHTWGSSWSVALPWSLDTQAQFAEKAMLAWRPMGQAEWLLSQRARSRLLREGEGLFVANPSRQPFSGWVRLTATCLRDDYHSLLDPSTGARLPLLFENGIRSWTAPRNPGELTRENTAATFPDNVPNQTAKFWVENLAPESFVRLRLEKEAVADESAKQGAAISRSPKSGDVDVAAPSGDRRSLGAVQLDAQGWPVSAQWAGMKKPLFTGSVGEFSSVKVNAFAPRWMLKGLCAAGSSARGDALRKQYIEAVPATVEGGATVEETPFTRVYVQWLKHPRLEWAQRRFELWKHEPRARVTLRFNRLSSEAPEIFYAGFTLPCEGTLPRLSNGGVPFTPFKEQIPGVCRDHFALDGWADYATPDGHWLWVSRDMPLVSLGSPQIWTRCQTPPAHPERLLAMLFNNFWYTNFVADEHGVMEFQFDLVWREKLDTRAAAELADTLVSEPVVLINSGGKDDPIVMQRLFNP